MTSVSKFFEVAISLLLLFLFLSLYFIFVYLLKGPRCCFCCPLKTLYILKPWRLVKTYIFFNCEKKPSDYVIATYLLHSLLTPIFKEPGRH